MTMIAQTTGKGNEQGRAVRPLNSTALARLVEQGGELRRGTNLGGAFPAWEFQWFDSAGQFVAPVHWKAAQAAIRGGRVELSKVNGVNR